MRLQWLLLPLQVQLGLGAYVQWKLCDDFAGPADTWDSVSLQASLEKSATQLSLTLTDSSDLPSCSNGSDPITSATLEIWLLGFSESSYTPTLNGPCAAGSSAVANQSARYAETLSLNQTMDSLYPLSSFELELHLYNATSEAACVSAIITPEVPRRTYHALLVGPLVILLVILVVSYCRRLYEEPAGIPEEDDGSIRLADYDSPVVNGIGNCLQHLQFVFLTACLNFSYPGFFQPALSSLNWLSLFSSSNAFVGGYEYAGISDGIYETNGTYGGTFGMEHMVQVLGAPMTMEIWINMLILVLILLAAAAILVMLHRIIIRQLQPSSEDEPTHSTQEVIKDTLRMVLTYFMIPIIAISSYQLDHVGELPSYFISLAVLLIAIIMAAYVWLFQNTSTQRLASLIFPIPQHTQETESHRRDLRVLVLVHFTLSFVKGIAIGGLQISGASQLAILMGCELAFLFSVLMLLPSVMFSGVTMCSLGRFIVLSLMITFLAPSSSSTKSIVSYAILALDLFILIVPILLLELYGFVNMWLDRNSSAVAPVYNLRRLRRRSHHLRQLPQRPNNRDYVPICVNCGSDPSVRSDTSATLRPLSLASSSVRLPRTASRAFSENSRYSTIASSSRDISPSANDASSNWGKDREVDVSDGFSTYDDFRNQRGASRGSYQSLVPAVSPTPGVDYSVREMDSYYREPRERNFGEAPPQTAGSRLMGSLDPLTRLFKKSPK